MSTSLHALFNPRGIVVFGSVKEGKLGHQLVTQLVQGNYSGILCVVNPKAETPACFPDIPAYGSLDKVAPAIDLALVAVPVQFVIAVIEACGRKGVAAAVVFTSGYSETGNREEEERLTEAARKAGVRIIGPNCAGIMNTASSLYASIEKRALPGHAALITQSGAVGGAVIALGVMRGFGFSTFVSYGNRADVGEIDLLHLQVHDANTSVVGMYVESIKEGRKFMDAVAKAARMKPVVILKAGKSPAGKRAASSHTGALAGSDDVFSAMVRQTGAVRASETEEFLDLLQGFSCLSLKGSRVAVVTNSGGPGILTTDRVEELGLTVPEPSTDCVHRLQSFLPEQCSVANPIDLTVEGTREGYRKTMETVLQSDFDAVIAINVATPFVDSAAIAEGIIEGVKATGTEKPVSAVFMAGDMVYAGIDRLRTAGIPVFATGERAAAVLAALHAHTQLQNKIARQNEMICSTQTYRRAMSANEKTGSRIHGETRGEDATESPDQYLLQRKPLLEPDMVRFMEAWGFSFPSHCFINDPVQLHHGVRITGFPLVMKVVSPDILHKSDVGGVVLGIESLDHLESEFRTMGDRFSEQNFQGVMLYTQVNPVLEMIAGINRDRDFGPVILAGAGGVLTELTQDLSVRIAPLGRDEGLDMLSELRIDALLRGYRGGTPCDREGIVNALCTLSAIALRHPEIGEMDLNPLFVCENRVLVGDVRIIM
jgi:acetyltransferase